MADNYYVIQTKLRREKEATEEIAALGFDCFNPIEVRRRKDRSKKHRPDVEYEVAMFPGYIFPRFDIAQPCGWQQIGRLQTVRGWLKPSGRELPSVIRDDFIDRVRMEQMAVRAALANDQNVRLDQIPNGTRVTILEGPFATLGGIVNMSSGDRIKIMLDAAMFPPIDIGRQSVAVA